MTKIVAVRFKARPVCMRWVCVLMSVVIIRMPHRNTPATSSTIMSRSPLRQSRERAR